MKNITAIIVSLMLLLIVSVNGQQSMTRVPPFTSQFSFLLALKPVVETEADRHLLPPIGQLNAGFVFDIALNRII